MAKKVLPKDADNNLIPTGSGFTTSDGTETPKTSPLTVSSTVITLIPPATAAELVIVSSSSPLRISEVVGMARYVRVDANQAMVIPCMKGENIYLLRDTIDTTVQFFFNLISS